MLRPLALIGTVGMMAIAVNTANAQQTSTCQTCNQSGPIYNIGAYDAGSWQYANCQDCECEQSGHCSLCSTKGFPDKGWNPPARYPVNRDGIWYRNYWPQAWYGNAGGGFIANSPMVYQPTDTTQLGYSYAKVPTWQNRRMIPPTPCPANYHARVCVPRRNYGRLIDGCPSGNPCLSGHCQSCQQGFTMHPVSNNQIQQVMTTPAAAAAPQLSQVPVDVRMPQPVEVPMAARAPQVSGDVRNAVAHQVRPASQRRKQNLFRLTGLTELFD